MPLPFLVCNFPLSEKMVLFTEKEHEKTVYLYCVMHWRLLLDSRKPGGYLSPLSLMGWKTYLQIEGFPSWI